MMNDYRILSKIYRQLAEERHHFQAQVDLVTSLVQIHGVPSDAKVLDAACGTGDVACALHSRIFKNLFAIDGSEHQLAQWPDTESPIPRKTCAWEDLQSYFSEYGVFDFVYILGHSFPHLDPAFFHDVVEVLYAGLNTNGILVLDIRPWTKLSDGSLVQWGREEGVLRLLETVEFEKRPYWLFEKIGYKDQDQYVEYRMLPRTHDRDLVSETVIYHMYHWQDAVNWISKTGFSRESIEVTQFPNWPYLVITCKKTP